MRGAIELRRHYRIPVVGLPAIELPVIDDSPLKTDYTGLIVDGRGLKLEPMLFPSIYDGDGVEIYGRTFIDSRFALKHGLASYCHTEDEARALGRAGDRPYYSVALKSMNACPVISERTRGACSPHSPQEIV